MLTANTKEIRWYRVREAVNKGIMFSVVFGCLALFILVVIVVFNFIEPKTGTFSLVVRFVTIASVVVGVIAIIAFLNGLTQDIPTGDWLREIPAGTIILDKESKKVVEVQDEDVVLLRSHPIFGERHEFLKIDSVQAVSTAVHPVTENPKVRNIVCHLRLKIKERSCQNLQQLFDFLHHHEMWKVGRDYGSEYLGKTEVVWEDPVRSMLYDFCNTHSRDLSGLFNPLRKEQVERFKDMVHTYFDPLLVSSGIEIDECWFSVS